MPVKSGTPTPQEQAFISAYVKHGDAQRAATEAGYSQPRSQGYQALARPAVKAEIVRIQLERLEREVLPKAVEVHLAILSDPKAPAGARIQAVKLAYDRVLGSDAGAQHKEPHEMTAEEIAEAINKLESVAASRAKPAESAQGAPNVLD